MSNKYFFKFYPKTAADYYFIFNLPILASLYGMHPNTFTKQSQLIKDLNESEIISYFEEAGLIVFTIEGELIKWSDIEF